jgi:hypothetical protein
VSANQLRKIRDSSAKEKRPEFFPGRISQANQTQIKRIASLRFRGSAQSIYGHAQPRFVPVSCVLLEHAFADRMVNGG